MDGWMGGWMDEWVDGWADRLIVRETDRRIDGWMIEGVYKMGWLMNGKMDV
ncbi:hypothetical protein DPMN_184887 [Dreissena polymorpha]|uniref:Uncharacterized protein n=1 Tax=Dreissena polymorpha TaxID=45954 RepID=A0A9D4DJI5_DREPO|nr:hypothetical protein DPMN_184887 [Dreissena polymorpha]